MSEAKVAVLMGSSSDWPIMETAVERLASFQVPYEARVLSAHRSPDALRQYAEQAEQRGLACIIAGAGAAAHLAGAIAAWCPLPVLGVPIASSPLQGYDALLSTVQMPQGVPVASFAIGKAGAGNAALFAVSLLALSDQRLATAWRAFREQQGQRVLEQQLPPVS